MASNSGTPSRGSNGSETDLADFPRPSVAVDIAVLTVVEHDDERPARPDGPPELAVLLLRRSGNTHSGEWGLPGSFVRERERLADAVLRTLRDKCGILGLAPRQLHLFDDPKRDDRGWVISAAHIVVVPFEALAEVVSSSDDLVLASVSPNEGVAGSAALNQVKLSIPGRQRSLPFDHDEIVALAVEDLRDRHRVAPDPAGLLNEAFTLLELRRIHEAVMGEELQKDTFRRQVIDQLEDTGEMSDGTVGRPARLFRRR